jgi:hypothetical protein
MAVNTQLTLLLYVTPFGLVGKHQHSGGTCWLIILDPESGASMFFLNIGAYTVDNTRRPSIPYLPLDFQFIVVRTHCNFLVDNYEQCGSQPRI